MIDFCLLFSLKHSLPGDGKEMRDEWERWWGGGGAGIGKR